MFGRGLLASGADYARLDSAANGAIVELTESQVPRLTIDTPVRFGNVTLRTENQVGGFPGVYGLWLKRVGAGWRLVFNNEYDVWGTQHDAKFDVADVELTHTDQQPATQPFMVSIDPHWFRPRPARHRVGRPLDGPRISSCRAVTLARSTRPRADLFAPRLSPSGRSAPTDPCRPDGADQKLTGFACVWSSSRPCDVAHVLRSLSPHESQTTDRSTAPGSRRPGRMHRKTATSR